MVTQVKLGKEKLKACFTCPICNNLFDSATTIPECLHTFCRKCIKDKITEEDLETCPVCNTSLGCAPLEKLRLDNSLQDLRLKLFPPKRENLEAATETIPAPLATFRKKEKSLSSIVANSPRVLSPNSNAATIRKSKPAYEKDRAPLESDLLVAQKPGKTAEDVLGIQSSSRALSKFCVGRKISKPSPEKNDVGLASTMLVEGDPNSIARTDHPEICSSSKVLTNIAQDHGQNSTTVPSEGDVQKKSTKEDYERFPRVSDLWKPLNCLAEAAGQSKMGKSNEQENIRISELCNAREDEAQIANTVGLNGNSMRNNASELIIVKPVVPPMPSGHVDRNSIPHPDADPIKASGDNPKGNRDEIRPSPPPLRPQRGRNLLGVRLKKAYVSAIQGTSHNAAKVEANGKLEGRNIPVWFSLVASENQGTNAPLPQISSCYLRVKDSNLTVSYIKKYLTKKLSLTSEAEVEITVRGQPLISSLRLCSLLEWWVKATPSSERISASVGCSGRDFVMVLVYGRKTQI